MFVYNEQIQDIGFSSIRSKIQDSHVWDSTQYAEWKDEATRLQSNRRRLISLKVASTLRIRFATHITLTSSKYTCTNVS